MQAILLGSGLKEFVKHFDIKVKIPYQEAVNFPIQSLEGHERFFYLANYQGIDFLILSGKLHYYEGYSPSEITAPLQYVIQNYAVSSFIITSASGGLSARIRVGEWYALASILCLPQLVGFSERIPVLPSTILPSPALAKAVYAYQQGPSLGTGSEYQMLHRLGADLVGMSMFPEYSYLSSQNINARLLSLPVCTYFPFSNIIEPSHSEVITIANQGVLDLVRILKSFLVQ